MTKIRIKYAPTTGVTPPAPPSGSYTIPVDFPNPQNATINFNGSVFELSGADVADIDFTIADTHTKYYVNFSTGSDSNDGLSSVNAVKHYYYAADLAIALAGPAEIILEDEWIGYVSLGGAGETYVDDIKIRSGSASGRTLITQKRESHEGLFAWVDNGDGSFKSNTLQYNHPCIFDTSVLDSDGIGVPLKAVASAILVSAEAGTFYWDGVYMNIRMPDDREPDGDYVYCSTLTTNKMLTHQSKTDGVVILENLTGYGNFKTSRLSMFSGRCTTYSGANPNTAKLGLKSIYVAGSSGDGTAYTDYKTIILQDCVAKYNRVDGFNYHSISGISNGVYMTVYEHNCISSNSGFDGYYTQQAALNASCNGSTIHDNMNILRLECNHQDTHGPVIADVSDTYSINYGCYASNPNATTADGTTAAYYYDTDGTGTATKKMLLVGCDGDNATTGDTPSYTLSNPDAAGTLENQYWQGPIPVTNGVIT